MQQVWIGILGAAQAAPQALLKPGRQVSEVDIYGVERTQRDSNPRHLVPKTSALSAELWVHCYPASCQP